MIKTTSRDGTTIAFDRLGEGPAVILVGGASTTRLANAELAALLAEQFSVFNYDRRGRGDSGDMAPYAVEREFEDLDAVIGEAGGSASLFGASSGAVLALKAAAHGLAVTKLALWEPPFMFDDEAPRRQKEYATRLAELLAAGRRGDAAELFMTLVGLPAEFIAQARKAPWWSGMEAVAHTLAYDAAVMGDGTLPTELVASVTVPTLVMDGGATAAWAGISAEAVAQVMPDARRRTLPGQDHNVNAAAIAPVIAEFLAS